MQKIERSDDVALSWFVELVYNYILGVKDVHESLKTTIFLSIQMLLEKIKEFLNIGAGEKNKDLATALYDKTKKPKISTDHTFFKVMNALIKLTFWILLIVNYNLKILNLLSKMNIEICQMNWKNLYLWQF